MSHKMETEAETARVLLLAHGAAAEELAALLVEAWPDGLAIVSARSLSEAVELVLDDGATFAVFDAGEGAEDQLAAVARLHSAAPSLPILVISEGEEDVFGVQAVACGAQEHLSRAELTSGSLSRAVRFSVLRKRAEAGGAHRALHDPLTGLPNRALFLDRLGVALDRSRRSGARLALLFIDIDGFRSVNDALGHAAGDQVLAALARRLRGSLRPSDTLARFGGDEFVLLADEVPGEREMSALGTRLRRAAQLPIAVEGAAACVAVSIGAVVIDDPTLTPDAAIRRADAAMREAKRRPRPQDTPRPGVRRHGDGISSELQRALTDGTIDLVITPRWAVADGAVVGAEVTPCWEHPTRGAILAGECAALAEESGLAVELGAYVATRALQLLGGWCADRPDRRIALKASAHQALDPSFAIALTEVCRAAGVDPVQLRVELPEGAFVGRAALDPLHLETLQEHGLALGIDEAGAEAALAAVVERMPLDAVVIDPRFVGVVAYGPPEDSMAAAIIAAAQARGVRVIAAGVDTDEQLDALRELGCDEAQGGLHDPPLGDGRPAPGLTPVS